MKRIIITMALVWLSIPIFAQDSLNTIKEVFVPRQAAPSYVEYKFKKSKKAVKKATVTVYQNDWRGYRVYGILKGTTSDDPMLIVRKFVRMD
jgi:hypothetical protein